MIHTRIIRDTHNRIPMPIPATNNFPIDTFAMERTQGEIKVGWGKYYGPMVEHGTKKMTARAHLKPLFEQNKEKYYRKMTEQIFS